MREIIYRGLRKDGRGWAYGSYIYNPMDEEHYIGAYEPPKNPLRGLEWNVYEVDSETVGQFTGLTDKNGRKIFEGDVCLDSTGWVFVVIWDSDNGRFLGRHSKPRGDTYICYVGRVPAVEIIGNRWDNPELLEGAS